MLFRSHVDVDVLVQRRAVGAQVVEARLPGREGADFSRLDSVTLRVGSAGGGQEGQRDLRRLHGVFVVIQMFTKCLNVFTIMAAVLI